MLVRQRSFGSTADRKLAVISTGPAANVKFEYWESYETANGVAFLRLGIVGKLSEPVPRYS